MSRYPRMSLLAPMLGALLLAPALMMSAPARAQTPAPGAAAPVTIDIQQATAPRSLGDAKAPIVIDEYASFTCPHCAHFDEEFLPKLKADFIDSKQVRLEFHDFPLDQLAVAAEMAARCLPPERYNAAKSLIFKDQRSWASATDPIAALKQLLRLGGMTDGLFQACLESKPLLDFVVKSRMDASQNEGVNGTPTFIIRKDGKKVDTLDSLKEYSELSAALVKAGAKAPPAK